ncbi:MAG TPA: hypothetical protein VFM88_17735 [Vicinamibacteria bacterium]|nr:hypothetical protein [Vicinamibacteria bacterium]
MGIGTTFRWTEHYGDAADVVRERLVAAGFAVAVLVLVAGAAGLVTLQGPYALSDSVATALSAL